MGPAVVAAERLRHDPVGLRRVLMDVAEQFEPFDRLSLGEADVLLANRLAPLGT